MEDSFLKEISKEFNIIFLCNPNNPTGILTKREFLIKVLEKCREHSVFLVVDECFLDFVKEPESYTLKGVLKEYPNLFLLKAFTKRYAMAGVRLGYGLTANRELLEKMEKSIYKALCDGRGTAWIWSYCKQGASREDGKCNSALECVKSCPGSRTGCIKRERICETRKRDRISGTGIFEKRNESSWISGLSFRGKLYFL